MILFTITLLTALAVTAGAYAYARHVAPAADIDVRDLLIVATGTFITVAASMHLVVAGMNGTNDISAVGTDTILIIVGLATELGGCRGIVNSIKEAS